MIEDLEVLLDPNEITRREAYDFLQYYPQALSLLESLFEQYELAKLCAELAFGCHSQLKQWFDDEEDFVCYRYLSSESIALLINVLKENTSVKKIRLEDMNIS